MCTVCTSVIRPQQQWHHHFRRCSFTKCKLLFFFALKPTLHSHTQQHYFSIRSNVEIVRTLENQTQRITRAHTVTDARKRQQRNRKTQTATNLSQSRIVQLPMIQSETRTTMRQVPGQMVISVLRTKRVLKLIRLRAPMLREEASVKSLLCRSITRQIRYRRRNIGNERVTSTGTFEKKRNVKIKVKNTNKK